MLRFGGVWLVGLHEPRSNVSLQSTCSWFASGKTQLYAFRRCRRLFGDNAEALHGRLARSSSVRYLPSHGMANWTDDIVCIATHTSCSSSRWHLFSRFSSSTSPQKLYGRSPSNGYTSVYLYLTRSCFVRCMLSRAGYGPDQC